MKKYEAKIKIKLINHLLKQTSGTDYIFASEVPINQSENIVDILQIGKDECIAFEVKSEKDNFTRLEKQLTSYNEVFDYTYIVVAENHYDKALALIPKNVGVLEVCGDNILERRKAKKNSHLNKENLAKILWKQEIIKILRDECHVSGQKISLLHDFELRQILIKKVSLSTLKKKTYLFLYKKYKNKYERFKSSIGEAHVHIDDLIELEIKDTQLF